MSTATAPRTGQQTRTESNSDAQSAAGGVRERLACPGERVNPY
jgi:hypothetical protein